MTQHPPENENPDNGPGDTPSSEGQPHQPEQQPPFGEQPTQAMPQQGFGEQPTQAMPPQGPGTPQDAPFSASSAHDPGAPGYGAPQQPGGPGYPGTPHDAGQPGPGQGFPGAPIFPGQGGQQHHVAGYPGAPQQPGGPGHPGGPQGPGGPGFEGPGGPQGPGGPGGPGGQEPEKKGFFARFWWAIVLLGVLFAALIALVIVLFTMDNGDDEDTEATSEDETVTEDEAVTEDESDDEDSAQEDEEEDPEDEDAVIEDEDDEDADDGGGEGSFPTGGEAFGDDEGMIVGEDIEEGTYRQDVGAEDDDFGCFYSVWEDDEEEDVIHSGYNPGGIVSLEDGMLMNSRDCGEWLPVEDTYPDSPDTVAENGQMYVIGEHIEQGTYQLNWDVDDDDMSCAFYVYSDLTGWDWEDFNAWFEDEDEWGEEEVEIHLGAGNQVFFHNDGCGEWELID